MVDSNVLRGATSFNPLGVGLQPEGLASAGARVAEGAQRVWQTVKHGLEKAAPTLQGKAASFAAGVTQPVRQLYSRCAASSASGVAVDRAVPFGNKETVARQFSEDLKQYPAMLPALKQCSQSFISGLGTASPEQLNGLIRIAPSESARKQCLDAMHQENAEVPPMDLHVQWSVLKLALHPLQTTVNHDNAAICRDEPKQAMQQAFATLSQARAEVAEAALHALAAAYQQAPETGTFNKSSVAVSCGLFQPVSLDSQLSAAAERATSQLLANWEVLHDV